MKRFLTLLLIICVSVASFTGCSNASGDKNQGYDDIANSMLTTSELNNLRQVVKKDWDYAFVAGDCIFTDEGYYKFEDVLEYRLYKAGVTLGEKDEREVFFARGESHVYGVYRTEYSGGIATFYAFTAKYDNPVVQYSYLGEYGYEEAFVGHEGSEWKKMILIGDTLIAYDYLNGKTLATQNVGNNLQYDFSYFQKGNSSVIFTLDGNTEIYTFVGDYPSSRFERVTVEGDLSTAYDPAVLDDVYVFGGEDERYVSLFGNEFDMEQKAADYAAYLAKLEDSSVEDGTYRVEISDGSVCAERLADGQVNTVTVNDIINDCEYVSDCVTARDGLMPEIMAVKLFYGGIYIVIEKEPDAFAGFRDVNDGIPPIVIEYDFESGSFEFCGLVDFTGFSVYKIAFLATDGAE